MFSEELAELDRNTVQLMIDEMQDEIDMQKKELENKDVLLGERDKVIEEERKKLQEEFKKAKEERKRHQKLIRTVYTNVKDVKHAAQLTGCSVREVQAALEVEEMNDESPC